MLDTLPPSLYYELLMVPNTHCNRTITLTVDHGDITCQVLDQTEVYQHHQNNYHYTITSENERELVHLVPNRDRSTDYS